MMKKYLIVVLAGLLAMGCKESGLQQDPNTMPVGEPIEVTLAQSQPASRALSPTTSQWRGGGIEGQLTISPIDEPQSKVVDDEKIANVWVLQFDGSATTSVLRYKSYVAEYVAGSKVTLLRTTTENRVVVVANSFDATWADSFALGTATWADVNAASKAVALPSDIAPSDGATEYIPMSGTEVATLAVGADLTILLSRTVLKVTVNFKSGVDLAATAFDVQLCNVPKSSLWFPELIAGNWPIWSVPATPDVINYPLEELTGVTTTGFVTRTFWLPMNRRGAVDGTTGLLRVTNAPAGATYLSVAGGGLVYKVHLGANFLTDYNLDANTTYAYNLTFQTDSEGTDSRVDDQRTLGALVQTPAGEISAAGATISVTSPAAMAGLIWNGSTDPAVGFVVGAVTGIGPASTAPVVVGVNPTNAVRTSVFTATALNGKTSTLEITQAASTLTYDSPSAATPVATDATSVDFTVTGTKGLILKFAKTSGDTDFTTPADHTCNGSAQTIAVAMAANTGAAREAVYSATVTNAGASGLNLTGITVKQEKGVPPTTPNPPTADQIVEIDGLSWAKGNLIAVNESNCKVGAPTDYGVYFHFGSLVGWKGGSNGDGTGTGEPGLAVQVKPKGYSGGTAWTTVGYYKDGTVGTGYGLPSDDPASGIGDPCRLYLGAPWRTPTAAEWLTLLGASGANTNKLLPLKLTNYDLSFPASGRRNASGGAFVNVGSDGYCWSSSVLNATNGYTLGFISGYVLPQNSNDRSSGMPVRCVSGTYVPPGVNPPAEKDYVTVGALKWTKGNLVVKNGNQCKVGTPTDYGLYFHFGSLVGWSGGANGDGTGKGDPAFALAVQVKPEGYNATSGNAWPAGYYQDGTTNGYDLPTTDDPITGIGDPCRYYLGGTWRTPTVAEWSALVGQMGANTNTSIPLKLTGYDLYFSASGSRGNSDGALTGLELLTTFGYYWSSSVNSTANGYAMSFTSGMVIPYYDTTRSDGMPVRCVAPL